MRFSSLGLLAGLATAAIAEDLLFVNNFEYKEYSEATTVLGLSAKVVTEAEWRGMTTAQFAAFKAIVLADPSCSRNASVLKFLVDTKGTWGPAVTGNIVLIGTDPSFHFSTKPGAKVLIDNTIKFVAAGVSIGGASQTGLYFALSCYYDAVPSAKVDTLSYFGDFSVRGSLDCYNNVHIVATSPALGALDDAALSNWGCSVHEAFSVYPSEGVNGFQALAIAKDIIGDGSKPFGGGFMGLPYILSRGATPVNCGNGIWEKSLGEECDDGNTIDGDGCSKSCKCESGRPSGDGKCLPKNPSDPSGNTSAPYGNATTVTAITTTTAPCHLCTPYVTPTVPEGPKVIGVEIIIYITIIEDCKTAGGSIATSYITSACSTMHKPIWDVPTIGYPCYVCEGIPTSSFVTASVTSCIAPPPSYTPKPPVIIPCHSCSPIVLSTCPAFTSLTSSSVYEVVAPSIESNPHAVVQTTPPPASVSKVTPTAEGPTTANVVASMSASASYIQFTGAASEKLGDGLIGVLVALSGAMGIFVVVL